jgi:hypothetical protein
MKMKVTMKQYVVNVSLVTNSETVAVKHVKETSKW